jgi:hypothetical protein
MVIYFYHAIVRRLIPLTAAPDEVLAAIRSVVNAVRSHGKL